VRYDLVAFTGSGLARTNWEALRRQCAGARGDADGAKGALEAAERQR